MAEQKKKPAPGSKDDVNKAGGEVPPSKDGEASRPDGNVEKSSAKNLQAEVGDVKGAETGTTSGQAGTQPQFPPGVVLDEATGHPVNTGPETGIAAPADVTADRYPSGLVAPESASGPLAPPEDVKTQAVPEGGYSLSSTDPVYAAAGNRSVAGEDHVGLVDDDGNEVSGSDLFDEGDGTRTFVTAKQTVWEEFIYPNTVMKSRRRLYNAGARVPRAQAAELQYAIEHAPEPADADKIS